jgi:hypothetical protein
MNENMEKRLAEQMLHNRRHGYSVMYILGKSAIRYAILLAMWLIFLFLNRAGLLLGGGLIFVTGMIMGAILRDVRWVRQSKQIWPMYARVIDWTKVEEIAAAKTASQVSAAP